MGEEEGVVAQQWAVEVAVRQGGASLVASGGWGRRRERGRHVWQVKVRCKDVGAEDLAAANHQRQRRRVESTVKVARGCDGGGDRWQ